MDCGVDRRGTDLELAMPRISLMLLSSPPPNSSPMELVRLLQPNPRRRPLSRFEVSTPMTPPPWPPTTPFLFTCSKGPRLTRDPSKVKVPCIWAYPISRDSGSFAFCGERPDRWRKCGGRPCCDRSGCWATYSEAKVSV